MMVDRFVERYNFAIYDGLVRKFCKPLYQNWKSIREIIPVPRHQPYATATLDS